ncbi:MAG: hypothetical protein GX589_04050 [Deltaproteobacteria bacterium]|nr:hypothetical protein [Deltaproteobacteria bacterium]
MNYRRALIAVVTFLGGIYFFLEFVLPAEVAGVRLDYYHEQITLGFITVGSMAVGLGLINLLILHGSRIVFMRRGALNSVALLLGLALMMVVTIAEWRRSAVDGARIKQFFMLRDFAAKIHADFELSRTSPAEAAARAPNLPPPQVRVAKLTQSLSEALTELDLHLQQGQSDGAFTEAYKRKLAAAEADIKRGRKKCQDILSELTGSDLETGWSESLLKLGEPLTLVGMRYGDWLNIQYEHSLTKRSYRLLYEGLFVPLGAAMFSLLAFYMATAAYRAFRVRSAESALMMTAAVVVMLGQIPFGVWIWNELPEFRLWLLTVPNSAAFRGIALGSGVAGLVIAFRMWLSIESDSFMGDR